MLPAERRVELYRRPEHGRYLESSVAEGDVVLTSVSLPQVGVGLVALFG